MSSRLTKAAAVSVVVLVAAVAAAQLVRPSHTNPATVSTHTLRSQLGATSPVAEVLDRSCGDCHSNTTPWRSYTRVAPSGAEHGDKPMSDLETRSDTRACGCS